MSKEEKSSINEEKSSVNHETLNHPHDCLTKEILKGLAKWIEENE